jgi:hypothetical protein
MVTTKRLNLFYLNYVLNLYKYFYFIFIFNKLNNSQFKLKLLIFTKKTTAFFSRRNYKNILLRKTIYNTRKHTFYKKRKLNTKDNIYRKENIYNVSKRFLKVIFSNRKTIKNFFFKKFTKQTKITRFIKSISKEKHRSDNLMNNYIFLILLRSHIFFFIDDVSFFLKKGFIMVNGTVVKNKFSEVKLGDYIQIIRSNIYYDYLKRVHKFFRTKISKIKFKRWSSFQKKKKTGISFKNWVPTFLDRFIFYKTDIPKFLEVDFFSLTVIILYKNRSILSNDKFFNKIFSNYLIKMYNWRIK